MNIQSILNDNSFQIAVTSSLVFLVVAFPPLFKFVDRLIAKTFGKRVGSNYYTVLIHAVVVGVLMFLFTSYILKPVFKMLTTYDVAKSKDKKSEDKKPKNILENFSVGGKMTCGGGK